MSHKVIIVGAGIAGAVLVIQLKNIGCEVEVFEARTEDDMKEGVFLGITQRIKCIESVYFFGNPERALWAGAMRFYNKKGKQIGELPTDYQQEKYGSETIMFKRPHLNNLIREEAKSRGINIQYEN